MSRKYAPNRIRELRKAKGWSMEELAARMVPEVTMPTVQKLENGGMGLTVDYMISIGRALGCRPEDLLESEDERPAVKMAPLVGRIAAGNWMEAIQDPERWIPVGLDVGGPNVFALRPQGDSMDQIVPEDGGFIVVDPDQLDLIDGKFYAIANGEGETTFKQYRASPPRLEPRSNNPEHKPIIVGREPFVVIGRVVFAGTLF